MKREPWAIGNAFAYAVRVLNCIFCRHPKEEGWNEDDIEANDNIHHLVAEQINSMCSDMMREDAEDILAMVASIPTGRLCERLDCRFHHPENPRTHTYVDVSTKRCGECIYNKKCKIEESKRVGNFDTK